MRLRHREGGFTLIEVVVAFAILALSLGALYESFGGSLKRSGAARQQDLAALRAESLLAEFRGSGGLLPQEHNGHDGELGFSWRITVKPYPAELAEHSTLSAEAVEVEVSWAEKRHRVLLQSVELLRRSAP
jgi:general secretion pathway protein I